jgi:acyl-CoA oxidase
MITQQVASYLIKRMQNVVESPDTLQSDGTGKYFQQYLLHKAQKAPAQAFQDQTIDDAALVDALNWRAAELVTSVSHVALSYNDNKLGIPSIL